MTKILSVLFLIITVLSSASQAAPEDILRKYIGHLENREWSRARDCWYREDIAKSERLGITYSGVPMKIDCASPLLSAIGGLRAGMVKIEISSLPQSDTTARVIVTLSYGDQKVQVPYYTISDGKGWRIVSPLTLLTADWPIYSGEYTRIHCVDSTLYNAYAASALNRDIAAIGKKLGLTDENFDRLRSAKIDYYLCNENQFMQLTGYNAHGLTVLPFDAVVTRHLPHPHELVHLLINYSLGELPLYEVPFMQEGLAVAYGGRWGKSPAVIKQLGFTILDNEMFTLEDILTYDDFYNKIGTPDISYPIAGIFVEMLIDQVGIDKFKALYRDLAGTETEIRKFSRAEIIAKIERDTGLLWDNLIRLFDEQWPRYEYSGLLPGGNGEFNPHDENAYSVTNKVYRIAKSSDMYRFEIDFTDSQTAGALLFHDRDGSDRVSASNLYNDLVPGVPYEGWEYGIVFDQNEVGLYDFRTNTLLAKYVLSFAPDRGYINDEDESPMYLFRIKQDLFDKKLSEYEPTLIYFDTVP